MSLTAGVALCAGEVAIAIGAGYDDVCGRVERYLLDRLDAICSAVAQRLNAAVAVLPQRAA